MSNDFIPISPAAQTALLELAAQTGRPAWALLEAAVEEFRKRLDSQVSVMEIPGVDPAEVWKAAAQAEAGFLTSHDEVFDRLRKQP